FCGSRAILSGPAGGVVGYSKTTYGKHSNLPVIGFDMGGRRKINQELSERQTRAAESFAPPRIEILHIEQLTACSRKKKATLSAIEIRTPRAAPGAALAWLVFLI
ncbi:hypothetical protein AVEN_171951-1, partial [Araneus ventricosus]